MKIDKEFVKTVKKEINAWLKTLDEEKDDWYVSEKGAGKNLSKSFLQWLNTKVEKNKK